MPFSPDDPLSSLGLEEPGGQAPPDDSAWSGVEEWPRADDDRANQAEGRQPGGDSRWDTEANPYKAKYDELEKKVQAQTPSVAARLRNDLTALQQQAAEAWEYYVHQEKWNPKAAEHYIGTKLGELTARAELEATREAALPHVRRGSADDIAREVSDKKAGVVVNADELMSEASMDGMRARAKALAAERRDHMVAQRRTNHIDRAEGGPPSNGRRQLPDEVSPALRIQYGLERGHI